MAKFTQYINSPINRALEQILRVIDEIKKKHPKQPGENSEAERSRNVLEQLKIAVKFVNDQVLPNFSGGATPWSHTTVWTLGVFKTLIEPGIQKLGVTTDQRVLFYRRVSEKLQEATPSARIIYGSPSKKDKESVLETKEILIVFSKNLQQYTVAFNQNEEYTEKRIVDANIINILSHYIERKDTNLDSSQVMLQIMRKLISPDFVMYTASRLQLATDWLDFHKARLFDKKKITTGDQALFSEFIGQLHSLSLDFSTEGFESIRTHIFLELFPKDPILYELLEKIKPILQDILNILKKDIKDLIPFLNPKSLSATLKEGALGAFLAAIFGAIQFDHIGDEQSYTYLFNQECFNLNEHIRSMCEHILNCIVSAQRRYLVLPNGVLTQTSSIQADIRQLASQKAKSQLLTRYVEGEINYIGELLNSLNFDRLQSPNTTIEENTAQITAYEAQLLHCTELEKIITLKEKDYLEKTINELLQGPLQPQLENDRSRYDISYASQKLPDEIEDLAAFGRLAFICLPYRVKSRLEEEINRITDELNIRKFYIGQKIAIFLSNIENIKASQLLNNPSDFTQLYEEKDEVDHPHHDEVCSEEAVHLGAYEELFEKENGSESYYGSIISFTADGSEMDEEAEDIGNDEDLFESSDEDYDAEAEDIGNDEDLFESSDEDYDEEAEDIGNDEDLFESSDEDDPEGDDIADYEKAFESNEEKVSATHRISLLKNTFFGQNGEFNKYLSSKQKYVDALEQGAAAYVQQPSSENEEVVREKIKQCLMPKQQRSSSQFFSSHQHPDLLLEALVKNFQDDLNLMTQQNS